MIDNARCPSCSVPMMQCIGIYGICKENQDQNMEQHIEDIIYDALHQIQTHSTRLTAVRRYSLGWKREDQNSQL